MSNTFKNPILTGFHPDPSICRVGEDFYLVNSTFEFFPGLPIYHSRDLVHWEQIGNALDRLSHFSLKGATDAGGLYAPTLRYWQGTYYLTCDNVSGGGNFIITANDPAGPWSDPIWLHDHGIDGSMFFDDDGKIYYSRAGADGQNGTMMAELDPKTLKLASPFRKIWEYEGEWNEGPHLYKIKGKYFLISATGGTESNHQEVVARADSPWGPFEACPHNPILTERDEPLSPIQCAGHGDLIEAPDGTWWMVFLGTRPKQGVSVLGRETFLAPVQWTSDGWPVVGNGHHVSLEMTAPKLQPFVAKASEQTMQFTNDKLGPEWLHIRNFNSQDYSRIARKGHLSIRAAKGTLNNRWEEPAFVGQRQNAFCFYARTAMEFFPEQDGEEAGLCVRANEANHYEIGLRRHDGKTQIFVRNRIANRDYLLAQAPVESGKVHLELCGTDDQYQFAWSKDGAAGSWSTLATAASVDLSRERTGGFTGTVVGLYATAHGRDSNAWADFAGFEMRPEVREAAPLTRRPDPIPLAPSAHWRIRTSKEDFRDKDGNDWSSDLGYSGGETSRMWRLISGTKAPDLYQTERFGREFSYSLPVLPGSYQVRLGFAETQRVNSGERVFDIFINEKNVSADFDIFKEAKAFDKALDKSFLNIQPDVDGEIKIRFTASVGAAKVCTIEIVRA